MRLSREAAGGRAAGGGSTPWQHSLAAAAAPFLRPSQRSRSVSRQCMLLIAGIVIQEPAGGSSSAPFCRCSSTGPSTAPSAVQMNENSTSLHMKCPKSREERVDGIGSAARPLGFQCAHPALRTSAAAVPAGSQFRLPLPAASLRNCRADPLRQCLKEGLSAAADALCKGAQGAGNKGGNGVPGGSLWGTAAAPCGRALARARHQPHAAAPAHAALCGDSCLRHPSSCDATLTRRLWSGLGHLRMAPAQYKRPCISGQGGLMCPFFSPAACLNNKQNLSRGQPTACSTINSQSELRVQASYEGRPAQKRPQTLSRS